MQATEISIAAIAFSHIYGDPVLAAIEILKESPLARDLFIYSDSDEDYGFDTVSIDGYYFVISYVSADKSIVTVTRTISGSSNEVGVYEVIKA
jgi:hypothetical protein